MITLGERALALGMATLLLLLVVTHSPTEDQQPGEQAFVQTRPGTPSESRLGLQPSMDVSWGSQQSTPQLRAGASQVLGKLKWATPDPRFLQSNATVLVHSYGGVGTSTYMNEMPRCKAFRKAGLVMNNADDKDGLKHGPVDATWAHLCRARHPARTITRQWTRGRSHKCSPNVRAVIYFYEEPVHAVLSLYRRDFASSQIGKMRPWLANCRNATLSVGRAGHGDAPRERNVSVDFLSIMSAQEYAGLGLDVLGFLDSVTDWLLIGCDLDAPFGTIIFARRSRSWQHVQTLSDILQVDVTDLPQSERKPAPPSSHEHEADEHAAITAKQLSRLKATYAPLNNLFAAMGDFLVLNRTTCQQPRVQALTQYVRTVRSHLPSDPCRIEPLPTIPLPPSLIIPSLI